MQGLGEKLAEAAGWMVHVVHREEGGAIKERLPYTEDFLETASPAVEEIIQDARGGQKSG